LNDIDSLTFGGVLFDFAKGFNFESEDMTFDALRAALPTFAGLQ
jgi:hypothetical protein